MKKPNHVGMGVSVAFIGTMALSLAGSTNALGPAWAQVSGKQQKIRISGGGQVFNAILADNETARDFASLLPLTLTMSDLFGREKTAQLPRAISDGRPAIAHLRGWGRHSLVSTAFCGDLLSS